MPAAHILVVDDEHDTADSLAMLLRSAGHVATAVYDAGTALDMAHRHHPELVFFDLAMPHVDGFSLARQLKLVPGMERSVLVCLTGYSGAPYQDQAREIGCDYFMLKPANPEEILRIAQQSVEALRGAIPE